MVIVVTKKNFVVNKVGPCCVVSIGDLAVNEP